MKTVKGQKMIVLDKCSEWEVGKIEEAVRKGVSDELKLMLYLVYGTVECFDTRLTFISNQGVNSCKIFLN